MQRRAPGRPRPAVNWLDTEPGDTIHAMHLRETVLLALLGALDARPHSNRASRRYRRAKEIPATRPLVVA